MNKKLLSIITSAVMAISVLSVPVSADDFTGMEEENFSYSDWTLMDGTKSVDGGIYKGMFWTLFDNDTLHIQGRYDGDPEYVLPDFSSTERPPFEKYKDRIKTVYVSEYTYYIGANTFRGYTNLERVAFAVNNSYEYPQIKEIGASAFEGCTSLKKFSCPLMLEKIGENAFKNCTSLTHFKMGVFTKTGANAFDGAPLSHVDIHKSTSVKDICTAGSGLPSAASCYHYFTAQKSPDDRTDLVNKCLSELQSGEMVNFRISNATFDVCDTAGCPLNTLSIYDLKFNWDPSLIKTEVNNWADTDKYQINIDHDNSGKFFSVYDPINGRYLSGFDYSYGSDFRGIGFSEEEAAAAGLSFTSSSTCTDYFYYYYNDIQEGKSTVSRFISSDSWEFEESETPAALGEVISVSIPLRDDQTIKELRITCWHRDNFEEIYSGTASEYSFTVNHTNAKYSITAEIETKNADLYQFVHRLYTSLLGRNPDQAGKQDWVNKLRNGYTATDVASGFVLSEELANQQLPNESFVSNMYWTFMGRAADEGGLANWTNALDSGCSYAFVLNSFVLSAEFGNICKEYGIETGRYEITEPRDVSRNLTAFTSRMYTKALGRDYEVNGLNYWTGRYINREISLNDMAYGFIFSEEFTNRNLSNEQYVDTLYATFFDRAPDAAGKADWLGQLNSGSATREQVLNGFLGAEEFANLVESFGL